MRLARPLERILYQYQIHPVILEYEEGHFQDISEFVRPYVHNLTEDIPLFGRPALLRAAEAIYDLSPRFEHIPSFRYLATILPSSVIEDIADGERNIRKVYYNQTLRALQTIAPYSFRRGRKRITFVTTEQVKKFLGLDKAAEKGFTGRGIKVMVIDTGASRTHPQLVSQSIQIESEMAQKFDKNGHGCVEPETVVAFTNPGLIKIEDFYERLNIPEVRTNVGITKLLRDKEVYTYSMSLDGKVVRDKVLAVHKVPIDNEVVKITIMWGRTMKLTPWHPVMVYENGKLKYKRADEVRPGDYIIHFNKPLDFGVYQRVRFKYRPKNVILGGDWVALKVRKVEKEHYKGYFYDLTTETYNNYYASGLVAHNTWCVSCILGSRQRDDRISRLVGQSIYVEGMAPDAIGIADKTLGFVVGTGPTSNIVKALERALKLGIDVVNMSLGGEVNYINIEDDPLYKPVHELTARGAVVVAAAGNSGPDEKTINTPGALPDCLTVGAWDEINGKVADFSSRGPTPWGDTKPDVIAPGVNILSATVGLLDEAGDYTKNRYSPLSGTSMATPIVAGMVTVAKQVYRERVGKELTTEEIKSMMATYGARKNNESGWGLITWKMFEDWLSSEYGVRI